MIISLTSVPARTRTGSSPTLRFKIKEKTRYKPLAAGVYEAVWLMPKLSVEGTDNNNEAFMVGLCVHDAVLCDDDVASCTALSDLARRAQPSDSCMPRSRGRKILGSSSNQA